jgi:hypothetical protein
MGSVMQGGDGCFVKRRCRGESWIEVEEQLRARHPIRQS